MLTSLPTLVLLFDDDSSSGQVTISPVEVTVAPQPVVATPLPIATATIDPVVVNVAPQPVTVAVPTAKATISPVTVLVTPQAVTATPLAIATTTIAPVTITVAPQAVTAAPPPIATTTISPVTVSVAPQAVTASRILPAEATGVWEFRIVERGTNNVLGQLSNITRARMMSQVNGVGRGEIRMPINSPDFEAHKADLLDASNIIDCYFDGVRRFRMVVDQYKLAALKKGGRDLEIILMGPDFAEDLNHLSVFPDAYPVGQGSTRPMTGPGFANWATLIAEAQAIAGADTLMTVGFGAQDSDSMTWPSTTDLDAALRVGQNLRQAATSLLIPGEGDWICDGDGALQAYASLGADRTSSVVLPVSRNQFGRAEGSTRKRVVNQVFAQAEDGSIEAASNASSASASGARQSFVQSSTTSVADRVAVATSVVNAMGSARQSMEVKVPAFADTATLWTDYFLGDTIRVEVEQLTGAALQDDFVVSSYVVETDMVRTEVELALGDLEEIEAETLEARLDLVMNSEGVGLQQVLGVSGQLGAELGGQSGIHPTSLVVGDRGGAAVNEAAITVNWDAPAGPGSTSVVGYEVEIDDNVVTEIRRERTSQTNQGVFGLIPNVAYDITVWSLNMLGERIGSATVSHTTAIDSTLPAQTTGLALLGTFGAISARWDPSTDPDVANGRGLYRVQVDSDSGFATPDIDVTTGSTILELTDLVPQTVYFVRIAAIDSSGNQGAWSASANTEAGQVGSAAIADDAIVTTHIADAAIGTAQIQNAAISQALIQNAAIGTAQIQNAAITSALIQNATIQGGDIAAFTIEAGNIAAGTLTATQIAAASITGDRIAFGTITGDRIAANTITAADIAANTITGDRLAFNTITASQIAFGTITGSNIAANTITSSNIQAGAISANDITAGTMSADRINGGSLSGVSIDISGFDSTSWHVDTNGRMWSGQSFFSAAAPFSVDNDGTVRADNFVIHSGGGNQVFWDGNFLTSKGWTSAGVITDFFMNAYQGTLSLQQGGVSRLYLDGARVNIVNGTDETSGGGGYLKIGSPTGTHLSFDTNDIQARSSSSAESPLYLNRFGGGTYIGDTGAGIIELRGTNVRVPQIEGTGGGWDVSMTTGGANELRAAGASRAEYKTNDRPITTESAWDAIRFMAATASIYNDAPHRLNPQKVEDGIDHLDRDWLGVMLHEDRLADYPEAMRPLLLIDDFGQGQRVEGIDYRRFGVLDMVALADLDERDTRREAQLDRILDRLEAAGI